MTGFCHSGMSEGGPIREFVERINGYDQLRNLLRSGCLHEGLERSLSDTWLSGLVPSKFPKMVYMRDTLEKRASEDGFAKLLEKANLKQPYGFSSTDLFASENTNYASSRIKRDCTFYFKNGNFQESGSVLTFTSKGIIVCRANKEVLVAAELHNMVAEKINKLYRAFFAEFEAQALPEVVKAWAQKEFDSAKAKIMAGEKLTNMRAYLRGLEYMAEKGRIVKTYTLDGNKAIMPKFKSS